MQTVLDWLGYRLVMWLPYWIACNAKSRLGRWCLTRAGKWAYRTETPH